MDIIYNDNTIIVSAEVLRDSTGWPTGSTKISVMCSECGPVRSFPYMTIPPYDDADLKRDIDTHISDKCHRLYCQHTTFIMDGFVPVMEKPLVAICIRAGVEFKKGITNISRGRVEETILYCNIDVLEDACTNAGMCSNFEETIDRYRALVEMVKNGSTYGMSSAALRW